MTYPAIMAAFQAVDTPAAHAVEVQRHPLLRTGRDVHGLVVLALRASHILGPGKCGISRQVSRDL